jgi:hypothetical protein
MRWHAPDSKHPVEFVSSKDAVGESDYGLDLGSAAKA